MIRVLWFPVRHNSLSLLHRSAAATHRWLHHRQPDRDVGTGASNGTAPGGRREETRCPHAVRDSDLRASPDRDDTAQELDRARRPALSSAFPAAQLHGELPAAEAHKPLAAPERAGRSAQSSQGLLERPGGAPSSRSRVQHEAVARGLVVISRQRQRVAARQHCQPSFSRRAEVSRLARYRQTAAAVSQMEGSRR